MVLVMRDLNMQYFSPARSAGPSSPPTTLCTSTRSCVGAGVEAGAAAAEAVGLEEIQRSGREC